MANSQDSRDHEPTYFESSFSKWKTEGAHHTAIEINQQPQLWLSTWNLLVENKTSLSAFLQKAYANDDIEIILTGAGTSAFIGEILEGPFQKNTGIRTCAIATTNLLTHPQNYFNRDKTTLLISFARSGNSPESMGAVHLANKFCKKVYHLIITCSSSGKLANGNSENPTCLFLLPPESNDQGLAMTGSFSSMLLAGLLISRIDQLDNLYEQVKRLARYGTHIINNYSNILRDIAQLDFERAVFLGSGPLYGTAREAHLKMQELTDGKIICKCDSFLGFRHGPKVVITPATLLVFLFSNNPYAHQYEIDLVKSINNGEKGLFRMGILESAGCPELGLDLEIVFAEHTETIEEEFLAVCSILPVQILSFYKSLQLGLQPDSPSENGTITRVVEGVTIYPMPADKELEKDQTLL